MKTRILMTLCAVVVVSTFAQTNRERRLFLNDYVAPEELVSMSKTLPFDKAVAMFSDFSKKYINKIIVDPTSTKSPIGVDIESRYWLEAFETILRTNNLWYEEKEEYFQVIRAFDSTKTASARGGAASASADTMGRIILNTRDVKISSVFFSVDVVKSANVGVNWSYLYSDTIKTKSANYGGDFFGGVTDPLKQQQSGSSSSSAATQQSPGFIGRFAPPINFSNLTALISFFQSNQLGDVISSPSVIITSGKKGRIQVGQDFYITSKDFAGNTVQTVQSAGTIIEVTPTVYEEKGMKFINLDIDAQRSTVSNPGPIINKAQVKTFSVLLDGEETVIGGLYTTSEVNERGGIPFLKDLPWWVFGLRYLFGYDKTTDSKQELIILLRVEIIPTLQERLADKARRSENLLEKQRREFDQDIEKRKPKK